MGIKPKLLQVLRERELETHSEQVAMNCEMCKFRLSAVANDNGHGHHHHDHDRDHHHHHDNGDLYGNLDDYHQRIWQVP